MFPLSVALLLLTPGAGRAQQPSDADCDTPDCPTPLNRSLGAVKAYVTAPLQWNASDWLLFGGAFAAVGIAHRYDTEVRTHFTESSAAALRSGSAHTLQDALPAAAMFVGTWGFANLLDDNNGRREARAMLEASVLSIGTAYVLNYASGRKGPDQTADSNRWWSGGSSFPSEHTTAAFAIGAVLAESGNPRYRWPRRIIGYGLAGFTAYERLKHNAHWLSDAVAGGVLGAASARFAMDREPGRRDPSAGVVALAPLPHGVMLRYTLSLP